MSFPWHIINITYIYNVVPLKNRDFTYYIDSVKISNIGISNINSTEVTFHWTWPYNNMTCSVSHYEITATNCGRYPNVTSRVDTQITYTDINTDATFVLRRWALF
jgi:hypothetical protein